MPAPRVFPLLPETPAFPIQLKHFFLPRAAITNYHKVGGLRAFLVAQLVKNLLAMQETHVQFLGWDDPLEEGMTTHSSILAWRIPMNRRA